MEKKDEIQYKIFYSSKNFSHLPSFLFPHNFVYLDCYSESQKTQESREVPGQANIFFIRHGVCYRACESIFLMFAPEK